MRPANGNVNVERSVLPEDVEGAVDTTVAKMMEIAHGIYGSRSAKIRALAINIVRQARVREKDYYGEIVAIHEWVKKNIRYMRDPVNQETLSHPEELAFNTRAGDCDDMVVLEVALLAAIGVKAWPVTIGMSPGMYSHVYLRAQVPPGRHRKAGQIINLDPIMKEWKAGREAPKHRVKQLKDYREMNMSGMGDDLGDVYGMIDGLSGLNGYITAPSYLDTEHSHAQELLSDSGTTVDKTVDTAPKVRQTLEGVDGFFAGMGAEENMTASLKNNFPESGLEVVEAADAAPMYSDGLRQLGPKGPMTARSATTAERTIPERGSQPAPARKVYEAPTVAAKLRTARGQTPVADVVGTPGQRIFNVRAAGSQWKCSEMPKTAVEEADEIKGLLGYIGEAHSFLPGLGAFGNESTDAETAEGIAVASWWARLKAKVGVARAAWAKEHARQMKAMGASAGDGAVKAAVAEAIEAEKAAKDAAKAAVKAEQVEVQAAKKDGKAAQKIAETKAALDKAEATNQEPQKIDALMDLGDLSAIEKQMEGKVQSVSQALVNRRGTMATGIPKGGMSPTDRRIIALRRMRARIDEKIKRLTEVARRNRVRVAMPRRPVAAPVPIKRVDIPVQGQARRIPTARVAQSISSQGAVAIPSVPKKVGMQRGSRFRRRNLNGLDGFDPKSLMLPAVALGVGLLLFKKYSG